MRELRDRGTTILFVSHSMRMVRNFCTEAALLHRGRLIHHGEIAETLERYQALISSVEAKRNSRPQENPEQPPNYDIEFLDEEDDETVAPASKVKAEPDHRSPSLRHGTGEARISRVEVLDEGGLATEVLGFDSGATIRVHVEYLEDVEGSILTIILRNKAGLDVFSTDTNREKQQLGHRAKGERVMVDFSLKVPLQHGAYSVTAAISPSNNKKIYLDRLDVAAVFKILLPEGRGTIPGLFHIPTTVEIHSPGRNRHD
jgi:ABC-2 type transport system ATP-binding protein